MKKRWDFPGGRRKGHQRGSYAYFLRMGDDKPSGRGGRGVCFWKNWNLHLLGAREKRVRGKQMQKEKKGGRPLPGERKRPIAQQREALDAKGEKREGESQERTTQNRNVLPVGQKKEGIPKKKKRKKQPRPFRKRGEKEGHQKKKVVVRIKDEGKKKQQLIMRKEGRGKKKTTFLAGEGRRKEEMVGKGLVAGYGEKKKNSA